MSDWYGVRDAACPLSTRGKGGGRSSPSPLPRRSAPARLVPSGGRRGLRRGGGREGSASGGRRGVGRQPRPPPPATRTAAAPATAPPSRPAMPLPLLPPPPPSRGPEVGKRGRRGLQVRTNKDRPWGGRGLQVLWDEGGKERRALLRRAGGGAHRLERRCRVEPADTANGSNGIPRRRRAPARRRALAPSSLRVLVLPASLSEWYTAERGGGFRVQGRGAGGVAT